MAAGRIIEDDAPNTVADRLKVSLRDRTWFFVSSYLSEVLLVTVRFTPQEGTWSARPLRSAKYQEEQLQRGQITETHAFERNARSRYFGNQLPSSKSNINKQRWAGTVKSCNQQQRGNAINVRIEPTLSRVPRAIAH